MRLKVLISIAFAIMFLVLFMIFIPGCTKSSPTLTIISPTNNSTVSAGSITITVKVTNFKISDKIEQANVAGQGHLVYFLDVAAPTAPGKSVLTDPGTFASVPATIHTWTFVMGGSHTFSVELTNNDETPLVPPVVAIVKVNAN